MKERERDYEVDDIRRAYVFVKCVTACYMSYYLRNRYQPVVCQCNVDLMLNELYGVLVFVITSGNE